MKSNSHRAELTKRFEEIFMRLLAGEPDDPYASELSEIFETIAHTILSEGRGPFDGVSPLWSKRRSDRKIEFIGEMWMLGGVSRGDTKEPFRATAVDKRITKQGIGSKYRLAKKKQRLSFREHLASAITFCHSERSRGISNYFCLDSLVSTEISRDVSTLLDMTM